MPTHVVLGRSAGIPDDKLAHVADDPLPEGVYTADEATIVRYSRASTVLDPITDELYAELSDHFDTRQIIEICLTVGLSNVVNRFHATFQTDLDDATAHSLNEAGPRST